MWLLYSDAGLVRTMLNLDGYTRLDLEQLRIRIANDLKDAASEKERLEKELAQVDEALETIYEAMAFKYASFK